MKEFYRTSEVLDALYKAHQSPETITKLSNNGFWTEEDIMSVIVKIPTTSLYIQPDAGFESDLIHDIMYQD